MKRNHKCPKCGSSEIIKDAKAIDRSLYGVEEELSLATFRKPDAIMFKGKSTTTVSAYVCGGCGYVEFYADSPENV